MVIFYAKNYQKSILNQKITIYKLIKNNENNSIINALPRVHYCGINALLARNEKWIITDNMMYFSTYMYMSNFNTPFYTYIYQNIPGIKTV